MHPSVKYIAERLSLRKPQHDSLMILDDVMGLAQITSTDKRPADDPAQVLSAIQGKYPQVRDFERAFPSVCFQLATGVGKTRLMGAFIAYLHMAHKITDFFVLAPNLTIYEKLMKDFEPNTPKYVFPGIDAFATQPPRLITGETYNDQVGDLFNQLVQCRINIFNISKINSEVRGGRTPRFKAFSEHIGESYAEYLKGLPNLVLLMDESHRYRGGAGIRALNELKPVLGLELTATPIDPTKHGAKKGQTDDEWNFQNVIYSYPLGQALVDELVKEPAVVTRRDFNPAEHSKEDIDRIKLHDGILLHEQIKVELEAYALESGRPLVKPFVLVIARDTTHAAQLKTYVESSACAEGRYREKVIQVDSSSKEEETVTKLLQVEDPLNPVEIVIHVNMLKEGWDVTNLYTIVPLRAANAKTLIEQTIGRGLRLPYGKRVGKRNEEGISPLDTLSIVAHDKFDEIVREALKPDSIVQKLAQRVLEHDAVAQRHQFQAVRAPSRLDYLVSGGSEGVSAGAQSTLPPPLFADPVSIEIAKLTREAIRPYERDIRRVPTVEGLQQPAIVEELTRRVTEAYRPTQLQLEGIVAAPPIAEIVGQTIAAVVRETFNIPRIVVVPEGSTRFEYEPFIVERDRFQLRTLDEAWLKTFIRTGERTTQQIGSARTYLQSPEKAIVTALIDFDDISYDDHADLLHDLASQVVVILSENRTPLEVAATVERDKKVIVDEIHKQMVRHLRPIEATLALSAKVYAGFAPVIAPSFTHDAQVPIRDFRQAPPRHADYGQAVFGGFQRCLHLQQKFANNTERTLAGILERESLRWFRPASEQFKMHYQENGNLLAYQPDFVAETDDAILMIETKAQNDMEERIVRIKRNLAVTWCTHASDHAISNQGKHWHYLLIPHTAVNDNATLEGLSSRYIAQ